MARPPLTRDTENQKIAGVCAGLGRYFDIDPVLVRILFVVFVFVGGGALLAYALLWLVVDAAPTTPTAPAASNAADASDGAPVPAAVTPTPAASPSEQQPA